ncbi:MAG: tRNA pseudouridine(55) synthase TruB [Microbacteriaceae bacterium]
MSGILLVDKSGGMTSHDVVARARRALGTRRVGHAGTLDPMATGLLVLGVGSATRLLTFLVGLDKSYLATIRLGVATDSDDADGAVTAERDATDLPEERIRAALAEQVGDRDQVPSTVSAIKVDGRRAYERARAGERVELAARRVRIEAIDVLAVRRAGARVDVEVRVDCSSGTYVRAIARDAGARLGVGGHLTALRRTRVGPLDVGAAVGVGAIAPAALLAPAAVATALFPRRALDAAEALALGQGKRVPVGRISGAGHAVPGHAVPVGGAPDGPIAAIGPDGVLVGIAERHGDTLRPIANFPRADAPTADALATDVAGADARAADARAPGPGERP